MITEEITVVTTSTKDELLHGPFNFYCYTKSWKPPIPRSEQYSSPERVAYMAELKNKAITEALNKFPNTEYILCTESYYLGQPGLGRLLLAYAGNEILGASTWYWDKSRILKRARFYDTWSTPGSLNFSFHWTSRVKGKIRVSSVGSCIVFPRYAWERTRFAVPNDFPKGCHYNHFCENSGLPVFLSLDAKLWRTRATNPDIPEYPWPERIRHSLNLRRLKRAVGRVLR